MRLTDFTAAVEDLASYGPDHTPDDLDLAVRSARAARLAVRYIHERDPAALADLFATLHRKS
ncbi:hypothetical protein [Planctomyces sp. SH-PL62]|uniref:hypothetical protein n=1 Tax=Planctomyces sp. SH-PL62 TaxID=1636152 RepID=UPI00078C6347|nr:hypothetical protein [Planctomyces sp. SH-PL62]AMV36847.1 hypothetical protein VT85_05405 [Planctomyces sp. SH-PL62]